MFSPIDRALTSFFPTQHIRIKRINTSLRRSSASRRVHTNWNAADPERADRALPAIANSDLPSVRCWSVAKSSWRCVMADEATANQRLGLIVNGVDKSSSALPYANQMQ